MHRSGTSLLASVLHALGFSLGQDLYPPDIHNPAGYFEDRECMSIQERILETLGQLWHGEKGMLPFPPSWWKEERVRPLVQQLEAWLDRRMAEEDAPWAFKDPRTTRFLGLWRELFAARNILPRYVLAIRDPAEVVASEVRRDGVPDSQIYHTWLRYNLEAVLYGGPHLAAVVDYGRWFDHGEEQMAALATALSIELQPGRGREILATVLRSELHRQDGSNQPTPPLWAHKIYEGLLALAARKVQGPLWAGGILAEAEYFDTLLRQDEVPDTEGLLTAIIASPQTVEEHIHKAAMLAGSGQRVVLSLPTGAASPRHVPAVAIIEREALWPAVQGSPFAKAAFEAYRWLRQRGYDAVHFPGGQGLAALSLDARRQGWPWRHGPVHIEYLARPDWLRPDGVLETVNFSAAEAACLDRRAVSQADHLLCGDGALLADLRVLAADRIPHAANSAASHSLGDIEAGSKGEPPLVSVCITHYNRPDLLRRCLDSVRAQGYSRMEVVLVDDGSDDPAVKPVLDALQSEFQSKGWRLIRQENRYLGAARNAAARAAEGEYLFFLDDDNLLLPDAITHVVGVAERSRADIVTSTLQFFSGGPEVIPNDNMPLWVFPGACPLLGIFENCYGDASALVRRACWEALGGFTEDRNVGHEDWEFFARAVLAGWSLEHNPEPVLCYRVDPKGIARSGDWEKNYRRGLRPYAVLLPPALATLPTLAGHLQRSLLTMTAEKEAVHDTLARAEHAIADLTGLLHVRENDIDGLAGDNARLSHEIALMQSSLSWRMTKPGRILVRAPRRIVGKIRTRWAAANEYRIIKKSGLFNCAFYESAYPDILETHVDPIGHYCRYGWSEGRNPSEYFDTGFYLETHRDVRDIGINPLVHYIRFGRNEGRAANPKGLTINGAGKGKKILHIAGLIRNNPDLLKRFFREMRRNGIKHAVKKAMAAAQRISALPTTATKGVADLWNLFSPAPNVLQLDADMAIDIIIPVYNGKKYLGPLFSSIISNTIPPYRLLIADDKSTDADILPLLYAIKSKNPDVDITIIKNNENMGFIKTVNKLARLAHGNFVLLNTDVEVPPHWLERLIYPLVTMDGVASTTPFTNSGTICSFPNYLQDNDLPSGMDVRSVDHAFSFVKFSHNMIEIPTGVGFCMGINKAVWDEIGGFDEVFGKGYGEENDWCMRAIKFGYRNLHVPNLFVYHKHGGSFLTEDKERYQKNNLAIINERYPDYSGKVQQLIEKDAYSFLRKCTLAKALCEKYGSIAIFDHDLGGGANQYVAESLSNHKVSIIVRYNTIRREFEASFRSDKISDLTIKADTLPDIKDLVSFFNVDELVINNLVSYPKVLDFIDFLCELTDRRIHCTYMMHDFYAICPMYNLINYEMKYCGVPDDHDYCNRCLKSNPLIREQVSYISSECPNLSISDWRTHFGRLLGLADKIVFFSQSSLAIASKAYPELCLRPDKLEVKPHQVTWVRQVATGTPGEVIHIGIIGVLTFTKGIHIVSALAGYIDSCQLNYRVHVFGEVADPQISLEQYSCVTLYGRYERNELPRLMDQAHIDIVLIPSVWPETFSYTTEEAIVMNLPVAVFDIGAPGERVRGYVKGIILRDRSPRAILESIGEYFGHPPITQRDAGQKQEDEIVFVCVSNNEHMYQRCVDASSFMTAHRIIKYNNSEHNVPIPKRYNSAISELLDAGYHGWIFFVHNDFAIMENLSPVIKQLPKEAVYGPIGAILNNGKKQIVGEILQGHNGALVAHGTKIDRPSPVDTVDCQCIFFHSDTVRKYPLRFDEADPLAFHQYAEEFCLTAKDQAGLQTYAVQIKCKHLSWGRIDASFDRAIQYINRRHGKRQWAGTCTHLDQR